MPIMPDLSVLPLLVAHGALVFKIGLAALFAIVSVTVWALDRRQARRQRQPKSTRRRLLLAAGIGGVAALIAWGLGLPLGKMWVIDCERLASRRTAEEPLRLSNGHACALAATVPDSRDRALWHLYRTLDEDIYRDEATLRRLVALAAIADGCNGTTHQLLSHGRYEDALAQALAVLPRVTTGRAALICQLVFSAPEGLYGFPSAEVYGMPGAELWNQALRVALRRDLLRMVGMPAEAARWDAIHRRFAEVLSDRRRNIALNLWRG